MLHPSRVYHMRHVRIHLSNAATSKKSIGSKAMKKSATRMRELTRVFDTDGIGQQMPAQIARLTVLYEDLRIELYALREDSFETLDVTDDDYRKLYFLRRALATLIEFAETVRLLSECDEFKRFLKSIDPEIQPYWTNGATYFKEKEPLLEKIRNDVGGHFGTKAAIYAIRSLRTNAVGKMEFRNTGNEQTLHLHFAGEVVATALLRHLPGNNLEEQLRGLIMIAREGFRQATFCTQFVANGYLWARFG
jgi:hypothetical protein